MRPEHSGRDGPGPNMRGASSANRGRGSFSSRDGGRPSVMGDQVTLHLDFDCYAAFIVYIKPTVCSDHRFLHPY